MKTYEVQKSYVIGNLQADRFYDRNNTAYYGDFSTTIEWE